MAREKTRDTGTVDDRDQRRVAEPLTDCDIARRAYDLYLARGREDGHDVEDWMQAERDLRRAAPTV